jgi:hypothetical protein
MARNFLLPLLLFISVAASSQRNITIRAFPITDYVVDLNDSLKIVQVHLEDTTIIKEKAFGVLYGAYSQQSHRDTIMIGGGRCNLIKSVYYYFPINISRSKVTPKENDLLYVSVPSIPASNSRLLVIASHYIELQDVYETPVYDRYGIFNRWSLISEAKALDSMVTDIKFTGDYFLKNSPSMNEKVKSGKYKDRQVLNVMMSCTTDDLKDFLDYIIARPRKYAGGTWKISEIFATWITAGAPTVVK